MQIFIMTGQPVTCALCGARAEIILEVTKDRLSSQLCKCPHKDCLYLFIEQENILETTNKHEH
jgi:hypothetical protein